MNTVQATGNWAIVGECTPFSGTKEIENEKVNLILDQDTGDKYLDLTTEVRGYHLLNTFVGVPLLLPLIYAANLLIKIAKLAFGYHFWNGGFNKESALEACEDALRILVTPVALIALEAASIVGCFSPNDGRKAFVKIEKIMDNFFISSEEGKPVLTKGFIQTFQPVPADPNHYIEREIKEKLEW